MSSEQIHPQIKAGDHKAYMEYAIEQARLSPPGPTNFCVGAVIVNADNNEILSTGYSLELENNNPLDPGTTHAEQCCIMKLSQKYNLPAAELVKVLPSNTVMYTTMEPCNKRTSGNKPCVERILELKDSIRTVYVGVKEPENFIKQSVLEVGREKLKSAGVDIVFVGGLEQTIVAVATSGHIKS